MAVNSTSKPIKASSSTDWEESLFNAAVKSQDWKDFFGESDHQNILWFDIRHLDKIVAQPSALPNLEKVNKFMLSRQIHSDATISKLDADVLRIMKEEHSTISSIKFDVEAFEKAIALGNNDTVAQLQQARKDFKWFACIKAVQLQKAAHTGDLPLVQLLVENGADLDLTIKRHNALSRASYSGHKDVVHYLLTAGANVNPTTFPFLEHSPLMAACKGGYINVVDTLLNAGALLNQDSSLQTAAHYGSLQTVERLLVAGAKVDYIPMHELRRPINSGTALEAAAGMGHTEIVLRLLQANASVNRAVTNTTALQRAANGGFAGIVRLLISAGACLNPKIYPDSEDLRSPIVCAAQKGDLEVVDILLNAGADVLHDEPRWITSIEAAAAGGHLATLQRLFQATKDHGISVPAGRFLQSLLYATKMDHVEVVRFLFTINPWPNLLKEQHEYLVQASVEAGNLDLVKLHLRAGAGIDNSAHDRRESGLTALQTAIKKHRGKVAEFLITSGANVDLFQGATEPPLHMAARKGDLQMVKDLVEAGADVTSFSYERSTVLEAAAAGKNQEVWHYLHNLRLQTDVNTLNTRFTSVVRTEPSACSMCQSVPLEMFQNKGSYLIWHPSLDSLQNSVESGCQLCSLLWNELGKCTVLLPQSSPVKMWNQHSGSIWVFICEPYPEVVDRSRRFDVNFDVSVEPFDGARRTLTGNTSSTQTFTRIRSWLDCCIREHPECQVTSNQSFFPTRLIDLASYQTKGTVRLLDTDSLDPETVRYVTLSHCWGGKLTGSKMTTQSNLKANYEAISIKDLPSTFAHAIKVTEDLGIRFLWIDALCIIQDSREDWEREISLMCDIYRHGTLCIAATASSDSSEGLFRQTKMNPLQQVVLTCKSLSGEQKQAMIMLQQQSWTEMYVSGSLCKRGWTLQERELSPRIVHFASSQVLWECHRCRATEGSDKSHGAYREAPRRFLDSIVSGDKRNIHGLWLQLVNDYTSRSLTRSSDVLPAIGGLARLVSRFTKTKYLAGIWSGDLVRSLGWTSTKFYLDDFSTENNSHIRHLSYTAPTWSFASVVGLTSFIDIRTLGVSGGDFPEFWGEIETFRQKSSSRSISINVMEAEVTLATPDPFGPLLSAYLRILAPIPNAAVSDQPADRSDRIGPYTFIKDFNNNTVGQLYHDVYSDRGKHTIVGCVWLYPKVCAQHNSPQPGSTSSARVTGADATDPAMAYGCGTGMAITPVDGKSGTFERVGHIRCLRSKFFVGVEATDFILI